jgi:hypothetical protein
MDLWIANFGYPVDDPVCNGTPASGRKLQLGEPSRTVDAFSQNEPTRKRPSIHLRLRRAASTLAGHPDRQRRPVIPEADLPAIDRDLLSWGGLPTLANPVANS